MTLTPHELEALRKKVDALDPEERRLLRDLATEQPPKPKGPARLPRAKPKPEEPKVEIVRSHNGTWIERKKR